MLEECVRCLASPSGRLRYGHWWLALDHHERGAIVMVSEKIVAKGKKLAAHILEAAEGDVEFMAASPSPAPTRASASSCSNPCAKESVAMPELSGDSGLSWA
jgi:hypothetical protein